MAKSNTSKFRELCRISVLEDAWRQVNKSNRASAGSDRVTIGQFNANLDANLKALADEIKSETFKFRNLAGKAIPKNDADPHGPARALRIPAVRDRVILKALQLFLHPKLEPFNAPFSYAYRKSGGAQKAIAHARSLAKTYAYVVEADIKSYFDSVDKKRLETVLFKLQHLTSLKSLLRDGLSLETDVAASVREEDRHLFDQNDERGIPQGSALSPLLANLYLSYFDLKMAKAGWELLRYADDIIIFANDKTQAERAFAQAREIMTSLGLDMHDLGAGPQAKSRIRQIQSDGVEFVGFKIRGATILPSSKTILKFRTDIETATEVRGGGLKHQLAGKARRTDSLIARATSINNRVEGKAASLAPCDDCNEITDLSETVKKRYIGMFKTALGVTIDPADKAMARLLEVPDLLEIWQARHQKHLQQAAPVPPTRAETTAWAAQNERLLIKAFDGVVAPISKATATQPELVA